MIWLDIAGCVWIWLDMAGGEGRGPILQRAQDEFVGRKTKMFRYALLITETDELLNSVRIMF